MEEAGRKVMDEEGRKGGVLGGWKVGRRGGGFVLEGVWVGIASPLEVGMAPATVETVQFIVNSYLILPKQY